MRFVFAIDSVFKKIPHSRKSRKNRETARLYGWTETKLFFEFLAYLLDNIDDNQNVESLFY